MSEPTERETMRKEVESVLQEWGTTSSQSHSRLAPDAFRRVREIAIEIIHGNIDREELSKLDKNLSDELSSMVQHLMSLKNAAPLRELQEKNPYYSPFGSKVIRDGMKKGER